MRTCAIVVFVKTPSLSPIKTRLARDIGRVNAEAFYTLSVAAIRSSIESLVSVYSNITPFFAVAEQQGLGHPLWQGWQLLAQGAGDLGAKLNNVYSQLISKFDGVLIIGSDSPQLGISDLGAAFRAIDDNSESAAPALVVGPSRDGGFYLVGASWKLPEKLWTSVRYSTDNAGRDLMDTALKLCKVITLPEEIDVDTVQDLKSLARLFPERSDSSVAHQALEEWLSHNAEPKVVRPSKEV